MKYAYPIVGRSGLCNMLFRWAYAVVYCRTTGAKMLAPQWSNYFRIGPWLRHERDKRYYFNLFTNEGYVKGLLRLLIIVCPFCKKERFEKFGETFFNPLIGEQKLIRQELERIANPQIISEVRKNCTTPFIGVHVRRTDFSFGKYWFEDDWYVRAIGKALEMCGKQGDEIEIRIFSDSSAEGLKGILKAYHRARLMPPASSLHDLLMLSHSKILVGTNHSTFSMWAVFLGQMPSIWGNREVPNRMYVDEKMMPVLIP